MSNQILPSNDVRVPRAAIGIKESVRSEAPGIGSLSWEDAGETLVFDVPWVEEYDACVLILGRAASKPLAPMTVDFGGPATVMVTTNSLHRTLPLQHPTKTWMYAWSIDRIERLGPRGKVPNPFINQTNPPIVALREIMSYETSRFTVSFRPFAWNMFTDAQYSEIYDTGGDSSVPNVAATIDESQRWMEMSSESSCEFLTRDGSTMSFANDPVYSPPRPFQQPWVVLEGKVNFKYTWRRVPEDFVSSRVGLLDNFQACLNCVNKYAFLGNPAGTLLLTSFSYERKAMPIDSKQGRPIFYLDITANMLYFNPEYLSTYEETNNIRGHNLAPMPQDNFKYHLVTVDGTVSGATRYQKKNFQALYRWFGAPADLGVDS